jgi:hypothetical protein
MICSLSVIPSDIIIVPPPVPRVSDGYAGPALAFALTFLIEWPLLAWWSKLGFRKTALFSLLINGMTWGVAMGVLELWPVPVPFVEAAIVLAEAALLAAFWHWRWRRALPISLGLNLASWLLGTAVVGLVMNYL